jgi:O-acetyl-ADP-ribose deacetylase (regulator of RNase III)
MSEILREKNLANGLTLRIARGDITIEPVDAIVNAANEDLQHGGGVAWAISRRGGETIQRESDAWIAQHGQVSHAEPAYTNGGAMPCKYVIHAVGPIWGSGDEDRKLDHAVRGSLVRADELNLASIAMPAISTGIFGFPKDRAAPIIFAAITNYQPRTIKIVIVMLYDQPTVDVFLAEWDTFFA